MSPSASTASVKVGDPDPTASDIPAGEWCNATTSSPVATMPWICTQRPGHEGTHIAGDGDLVCAVWGETR